MTFKASGRLALIIAAAIWINYSGPLHAQEATAQAAPGAAQQPVPPNLFQSLFGAKPAAPAPAEQAADDPGKPIALTRYTKRHSRHHHRRRHTARSHKHKRVAKESLKSSRAHDEADEIKTSEDKASRDETAQDKSTQAQPAQAQAAATTPKNDDATAVSASVANARAQLVNHAVTAGAPATMTPAQNANAAPTPSSSEAAAATQPASPPAVTADASGVVVPADQVNEIDRAMNSTKDPAPTLAMASMNPQGKAVAETTAAANDNSTWAQTSMVGKIFIAFGGLLMLASAARMFMA